MYCCRQYLQRHCFYQGYEFPFDLLTTKPLQLTPWKIVTEITNDEQSNVGLLITCSIYMYTSILIVSRVYYTSAHEVATYYTLDHKMSSYSKPLKIYIRIHYSDQDLDGGRSSTEYPKI